MGSNFRSFLDETKYVANALSHQQLEDTIGVLRKSLKRRFAGKRKTPKYGTLNKGFTEPELQHFLRNVKSEKFRLMFRYQAFMGLRIGEACKLHVSNIGFDNRELRIHTEKAQIMDSLRIPVDLCVETKEYIARNAAAIKAANGYLFFKDNDNNHNRTPYVDVNYARKVFREAITKAGLDYVYGESEETYQNHSSRSLHRLTTHSLRHYAITRFAKATNGNVVLTSRFARHSDPYITMRYIAKDNNELYENIDFAFSNQISASIKRLQSAVQ